MIDQKVEFFHQIKHKEYFQQFTLAFLSNPRLYGNLTYLSIENMIDFEIGLAKCNPKDNFNKSLGRNLAISRLSSVFLLRNSIIRDGKKLLHTFETPEVIFTLSTHENSNKVRLVSAILK